MSGVGAIWSVGAPTPLSTIWSTIWSVGAPPPVSGVGAPTDQIAPTPMSVSGEECRALEVIKGLQGHGVPLKLVS